MTTIAAATIPSLDPLPVPGPIGLMWGLLMLTFFLHLLAMNFVLGGSLIAAVARLRGGDDADRLVQWLAKMMPTMVAATVTFGVAPLLFLQALHGRLFFSSAVLMAWFWLAVVPLVIIAYYGTYLLSFRGATLGAAARVIAVIVALIFVSVGFIYSNNMSLMLRADRFLPLFVENARGVQLNLTDATLVPRYFHMLFGAIALAGLFVGLYGVARRSSDLEHARWAMRFGAFWFAGATALNILSGVWWLGVLPQEVMFRFMGRSPYASVVLGIGILLGFASAGLMLGALFSDVPEKGVMRATGTTLLTLVAMILARDEVRRGTFELVNLQPQTWVEPQWGVIALFLALLVAALATTAWMTSLLVRAHR